LHESLASDGNKTLRDSLKGLVGYCNNPQPDFSTPKHRRVLWCRVPPGALAKLANSRAVTFKLGASHDIHDASSPRALAAFTTTERTLLD